MTDLDELIRASLQDHTPAAAPDQGLAGRVRARGRRLRTVRAGGLAALVLAVIGGVAWGVTALPGLHRSTVVASPAPGPSTIASVTTGPAAVARDVSALGEPGQYERTELLDNYFASPTGNFYCFISTKGAGCQGHNWEQGVVPSNKLCKGEGAVMGPELWGTKAAAWACGTDPHSLPFLSADGGDGVAWWDASFGESIPAPTDPTMTLAVLPYGKTLIAGDFRCTMATEGVSCTNSATGQGFLASRARVDLHA